MNRQRLRIFQATGSFLVALQQSGAEIEPLQRYFLAAVRPVTPEFAAEAGYKLLSASFIVASNAE